MKKKELKSRIAECEAQIAVIQTLPYYSIFNREAELRADLDILHQKIIKYQNKIKGKRGKQKQ
jgi:hypothetical protein